jgi:hypothetical protein
MTLKVQHKRSAVRGKAPLPTDLEFGEIAINYEASNPSFYIKDSAGAIRRIGSQLGALVFKGSLAPTAAAPTAPNIGDVYVMSADGTMAASWVGVAGRLVVRSENIAWSGTEWESLGNDRVHGIHIGETPPATPSPGQQWFRSSTGKLYVYYDDGTGAAQWVVANPQEAVDYTQVYKKTEADTKFVDVSGDTMTGALIASTVQSSSTTGDGFISLAYVGGATNAPTLFLKQNNKNFFALTATDRFYVQTQSGYIPQWIYEQAPGNAIICLGNYTAFGTANSSTVNISEELNSGTCPLRINGTAGHTNNLTRWTKAGAEVARIAETGAYYNNSDRRLKDNIADLPYGLKEIKQIQPKTFTWKNDCKEHPTTILGVIAQDIQRIIPEIISEGTPDEDGVSYLGIDSTGLTHVLINAVKELSAQVDQLTQRLAALEVKP